MQTFLYLCGVFRTASGYVAAYLETQNCFGDAGLMKVLEHAEKHEHIVGGWQNEDNKLNK